MLYWYKDDGIYLQRVPLYLEFDDKDKDVKCYLDENEESLHDSVSISSVILFDASQCPHCTFDPNGEISKGKKETTVSSIICESMVLTPLICILLLYW